MNETTEGGLRRAVIYDARKHIADRIQEYYPDRQSAMQDALTLSIGDLDDAVEIRDYLTAAYAETMPLQPNAAELRAAASFALWLKTIHIKETISMDTLMLPAMIVGPDYGLQTHRWAEWITPKSLRYFLDPKHGQECLMYCKPGGGKTHLKILIAEAATNFGFRVIHNIGTLQMSEHQDKVHYVRYYSDVLKLVLKHPDEEIIFLWDEPSNSIDAADAARTESKQLNKARSIQRKLRMATLYGYQSEGQTSSRLREANSASRIDKRAPQTMTLRFTPKGSDQEKIVNVVDLPDLAFSTYDDKAPATLIIDVDMEVIVQVITTERTFEGQKKAMKLALTKPEAYLEKYRSHHGFDEEAAKEAKAAKKAAAKQRETDIAKLVNAIVADPTEYSNQRGTIDRDKVYQLHGPKSSDDLAITWAEARDIAVSANKKS